ncbi:MAG: hypothetical protein MK101_07450 [Phycisphaerales bacterium]|nr:hypothetical protein [Phycisphaerales bacterium]
MISRADTDPIRVAALTPPPCGLDHARIDLRLEETPAAVLTLCRRDAVDVVLVPRGVWPRADAEVALIDPSLIVLRHLSAEPISRELIEQAALVRRRVLDTQRAQMEIDSPHEAAALVGESEPMSGLKARLRQLIDAQGVLLIAGAPGTPLLGAACWLQARSAIGPVLGLDLRDPLDQARLCDGVGPSPVHLARGGTLIIQHVDRAPTEARSLMEGWASSTCPASVIATVGRDPATPGAISPAAGIPEGFSARVVRVPTLHERRTDIPMLVAQRHGARAARADLGVEPGHTWPGNDEELALRCRLAMLVDSAAGAGTSLVCDEGRSLADLERQAIVATLKSQGGHRRRTAEALGIGLRTLGVKLSQWRDAHLLPPGV